MEFSIGIHKERNQIVVYGGGTHLSKEFQIDENGNKLCGWVVSYNKDGSWTHFPKAKVTTLSQEHGIITFDTTEDMEGFNVGGVIGKYFILTGWLND